jgi:hypothetical protein
VGGCTFLESIVVDSENTDYYSEDNCLVVKASKKLIAGCKTSIIPNDITYIAPYAFADCKYANDVVIHESVGEIGGSFASFEFHNNSLLCFILRYFPRFVYYIPDRAR